MSITYRRLYFDSRNRTSTSTSTANFSIPLTSQNLDSSTKYKYSLLHATIPNTIYNITSSNNTLNFNHPGAFSVSVAVGAYDITTLLAALSTAMTTASPTFVCTFSNITQFVQIAETTPSVFTILGTSTILSILGLPSGNTTSVLVGANQVVLGTAVPQVVLPFDLIINIPELGNTVLTAGTSELGTFIVPVNANAGQIITYDSNAQFWQTVCSSGVQNFTVSLRSRSQQISLNGAEWSFILGVEIFPS